MRSRREDPRSFRHAPLTSSWMRRSSTSTIGLRDCLKAVEKSADQPSERAMDDQASSLRAEPASPLPDEARENAVRQDGPNVRHAVRYQMREKLLSIGDDSWIDNADGERVFKVNGKALRARKTLVL